MILTPTQHRLVNDAIAILSQNGIAYLCFETRVGKTPVSVLTAAHTNLPILFITKKAAIGDITKTIAALNEDYPLPHVEVMSFDSLHKIPISKRVIIADEAHSFGTYPKPSLRAKQLRKLSDGCPVIMLSATPTPESFSQMYHQLWAANCNIFDEYKNFYHWAQIYVNKQEKTIGWDQKVIDYSDARSELILPQIKHLMLECTKAQAGFAFSEPIEQRYYVAMPDHLREIVHAINKKRIYKSDTLKIVAGTAASKLSKVHQLCSGTVIDDSDVPHIVSAHKIPAISILQAIHGKIAVYYKFVAELAMLNQAFPNRITSDPSAFRESTGNLIFAKQFVSGREGIDLQTAKAIIFLNIDHSYLSYEQTKNRLANMSREDQPIIVFLITIDGIEEDIIKIVKQKRKYTAEYYTQWKEKI